MSPRIRVSYKVLISVVILAMLLAPWRPVLAAPAPKPHRIELLTVGVIVASGLLAKKLVGDLIHDASSEARKTLQQTEQILDDLVVKLRENYAGALDVTLDQLDDFSRKQLETIYGYIQALIKQLEQGLENLNEMILKDIEAISLEIQKDLALIQDTEILFFRGANLVLDKFFFGLSFNISLIMFAIMCIIFSGLLFCAQRKNNSAHQSNFTKGQWVAVGIPLLFVIFFGIITFSPPIRAYGLTWTEHAKQLQALEKPDIFQVYPATLIVGETKEIGIIGTRLAPDGQIPTVQIAGLEARVVASDEYVVVSVADLDLTSKIGMQTISLRTVNKQLVTAIITIETAPPLPSPVAVFDVTPVSGRSPLTVQFHDSSTGNPTSWEWDFGDGSEPSYEPNPSHTFKHNEAITKSYTVALKVTNESGSATERKENFINVGMKSFESGAIEFFTISRNQIDRPLHDYPLDQYVCGIVGMGAYDGNINATEKGKILTVKMFGKDEGGRRYWTPTADFLTENDEDWKLDGMCLRKDLSPPQATGPGYLGGWIYKTYSSGNNQIVYTDIPHGRFVCGIVGLESTEGDIDEISDGDILKVRPIQIQGLWAFQVDFHSHAGHHEEWPTINVLCLDKTQVDETGQPLFKFDRHPDRGANVRKPTEPRIHNSDYACGIVGMYAQGGNINEDGEGWILVVSMYPNESGLWFIRADFRTEPRRIHHFRPDEPAHPTNWSVESLCVSKPIAVDHRTDWIR